MKTFALLPLLLTCAVSVLAAEPTAADTNAPALAVDLGKDVIARVGGQDVPYDWFVHEYQASVGRQGKSPTARQKIFDDFLARMILYDAACQSGVTNNAATSARIDAQLERMQEFLQYQLAMARVGLTIEAYLKQEHLMPEPRPVTEEDAHAFFVKEIAALPGAPATYEELPAQVKAQIRERASQVAAEQELRKVVEQLRTNITVVINQPLVEAVPLPETKGDVPEAFRKPAR